MKRFLFLIALFTLLGGVNSVKARDVHATIANGVARGNATWTQVGETSTYTYTWTDTGDDRNDYISLFTAFGGVAEGELDWSDGTNFIFTCSGPSASETNALNVIIVANGNEFSRAMYSDGTKTLTLTATSGDGFKNGDTYITAEDLEHVTDIRIQATNKSGFVLTAGSVNVENFYVQLSPKASVSFNASGVATINLDDIDVTGNVTYDSETKIVTSTGSGTFQLNFNKADFTKLTKIALSATTSGTESGKALSDILSSASVKDNINGTLVTWSYSKWNYDFSSYKANASQVISITFNVNTSGSMKINSITLTAEAMSVVDAHDVPVASLPHYIVAADGSVSVGAAISTNYGKAADQSLGDGSSNMDEYLDIEDYDELRVYTDDTNDRLFFINETITTGTSGRAGGTLFLSGENTKFSHNTVEGYYYASIATIKEEYGGQAKLIGAKGASWGATSNISKIQVLKENPAYDYVLSGQYSLATVISSVTSDASATAIDCSNLSGNNVSITSSNPNCMFKARAGVLANNKNVIVDVTCANLVLTDGHPFKAPENFTADAASYTRDLGSAGAATLCLPFDATIPGEVTAYTLTYSSGDKAAATPVNTTIPANTPVLLNGTGEKTFSGSSVSIDADAANEQGALTGVFQATFVPKNSYVLQDGTNGVGFYKVATNDIEAKPFRAYLTAAGGGARGFIGIDEMSPTGVNEVKVNKAVAKTGKIYNLNGQIVSKPTKGLYIIDGKVVSF